MMNEPVAQLPHLTDEELEELWTAIQIRMQHMRSILATAQAELIQRDAKHVLQLDLSLSTAIAEARMDIARRRPTGE